MFISSWNTGPLIDQISYFEFCQVFMCCNGQPKLCVIPAAILEETHIHFVQGLYWPRPQPCVCQPGLNPKQAGKILIKRSCFI